MFHKILQWIKGVWQKMIELGSVKKELGVNVAVSSLMADALSLWSLMYQDQAPWLTKDVQSMNLAAAIAGEIASAATVEMQVEFSGSARAAYLQEQFSKIIPKLRDQIEAGCAKGGLVMKPYVDGKKITVDFVSADMLFPVSFDGDGDITGCIFVDQIQRGSHFYTRLELHQMTPKGSEITNRAFRSSNRDTLGTEVALTAVDVWQSLEKFATIENVDRLLLGYFKYPQFNTVDPTSPLGVSCYSRAVKLIEQADKQWSNLLWEFESGQRALYADVTAYTDQDGKMVLPQKRLYRALNGSSNIGDNPEGLYHEWSPTLREQNILNGLDAILRRIEFECGLAYGTLSNPATVDKTATELKMSRQRTYVTITSAQKALKSALEQLVWAMDQWADAYNLAPRGTYQTAFQFDDSVVTDTDTQFQQDMRLVQAGLMSKWEFRMRNYKESEAVAKQKVADAQNEQAATADLFAPTQGA